LDPALSATETDPRFPSGPWVGFFVQPYPPVGKHWMELRLTFHSGTLTGQGRDWVGRFAISGVYDVGDGRCRWKKTYVQRHDVFYDGFNEGKGIWGRWEIQNTPVAGSSWHGGFHIWPEGMRDPSDTTLEVELDLPAEAEVEARPLLCPAIGNRMRVSRLVRDGKRYGIPAACCLTPSRRYA
jgi:hypothetical protein